MASQGMIGVVISLMVGVAMGAIVVNQFANVLVDQKTWDNSTGIPTGTSLDFNNTVDNTITYTWLTFGFLSLGILIVGAAWILRQVGMLG